MARSSWKLTPYDKRDLIIFYKKFFYKHEFYMNWRDPRILHLNFFNYTHKFSIHTGKNTVIFQTADSIYLLNKLLGSVTKTRKPFFFRSSKKR